MRAPILTDACNQPRPTGPTFIWCTKAAPSPSGGIGPGVRRPAAAAVHASRAGAGLADEAGFSVAHLAHGVEEVGRHAGAGADGGLDAFIADTGVLRANNQLRQAGAILAAKMAGRWQDGALPMPALMKWRVRDPARRPSAISGAKKCVPCFPMCKTAPV